MQIKHTNSLVVSSNQTLMKIFIQFVITKIPEQKKEKIMYGFMMINKNKILINIIKAI